MSKPQLLEDEIGRKLAEAQRTGELKAAASYGKPMPEDAGWQQTPEELRMGFKVLKNAGVVPPEVELLRQRAKLQQAVAEAGTDSVRRELQAALSTLEQTIALRLEALRRTGSL